MTSQSDAMSEPPFETQSGAAAALSPTRPFYWSVRRELWEHRSIYVAPLAAAGVIMFGFLLGMMALSHRAPAAFQGRRAAGRTGARLTHAVTFALHLAGPGPAVRAATLLGFVRKGPEPARPGSEPG